MPQPARPPVPHERRDLVGRNTSLKELHRSLHPQSQEGGSEALARLFMKDALELARRDLELSGDVGEG